MIARVKSSGVFIASKQWERLVVVAFWLARKPMVRQGVPPVSDRWRVRDGS